MGTPSKASLDPQHREKEGQLHIGQSPWGLLKALWCQEEGASQATKTIW